MSELKDAGTLIRLAYQGLLAMGVDADAVLLATPAQGFSQERLLACRDDLRARAMADA